MLCPAVFLGGPGSWKPKAVRPRARRARGSRGGWGKSLQTPVGSGGILNLAFSGGSYADGTDVLQIFPNTGGRSGSFSAVNATGLAAGQSATFNPATGFITVVPEPSTIALVASAGAGLAGAMRRRKRRAARAAA